MTFNNIFLVRKPDKKKKTPYCYFAVPDDDTTHTKIEGSVLEGMYWKRRMEAVCAQYKRWRTYNRPAKKKSKACCRKRVCYSIYFFVKFVFLMQSSLFVIGK
jgi:hypothetical protein